jgi:hypothetical protein
MSGGSSHIGTAALKIKRGKNMKLEMAFEKKTGRGIKR